MNKHLIWAISLIIIVTMICATAVWINYNSWTIRFEMDNNTKEAIDSFEWDNINDIGKVPICEKLNNYTFACPEGYSQIQLGEKQFNEMLEWAEWKPYNVSEVQDE